MEKDVVASIMLIHERLNKLEASMDGFKGLEGRKGWDSYEDTWGFEQEAQKFLGELALYKQTSPADVQGGVERKFMQFRAKRGPVTKGERDKFQIMIIKAFPTQRDAFNKEVMNAFWKVYPPDRVVR
jgi:hypothetical protein